MKRLIFGLILGLMLVSTGLIAQTPQPLQSVYSTAALRALDLTAAPFGVERLSVSGVPGDAPPVTFMPDVNHVCAADDGSQCVAAHNAGFWVAANIPASVGGDLGAVQSIAIGKGAVASATTNGCLGIGWFALNKFTQSGSDICGNTAIGQQALEQDIVGQENTAVGQFALANTTGAGNTGVGQGVMQNATTMSLSTALGWGAAFTNTTGGSFTAIGYSALFSQTTGGNNVAVGQDALFSVTTGTNNAGFGYLSGKQLTTQSGTVILGSYQGSGAGSNTVYLSDGGGNIVAQGTSTSFDIPSVTRVSHGFTVATLPAAGTQGRRAYVTDATSCTFMGALTGGGSVVCPVFDNGTAWVGG